MYTYLVESPLPGHSSGYQLKDRVLKGRLPSRIFLRSVPTYVHAFVNQ